MRYARTCLLVAASVVLITGSHAESLADSLNDSLRKSYENHVFGVRYAIHTGEQKFDAAGHPMNDAAPPVWEIYGGIFIQKLSLSDAALRIDGPRVVLDEHAKANPGVMQLSKSIRFVLQLDHPIASAEDAAAVLNRVFYLDDHNPEHLKPEYRRTRDSTFNEPVFTFSKEDASVTAPKPEDTPEPVMNDLARRERIQGTLLFTIVVDKKGTISDIKTDKALGYGLEENSIESLKKWRFKPATRNGEPVALRFPVEVSFHLY